MQTAFGFLSGDIARWHGMLAPVLTTMELLPPRRPVAQLVKSIISARTRDAVSQGAFDRLRMTFGGPARLAVADIAAVERVIADVTYASDKASYVVAALQRLRRSSHGFDLDRLADGSVGEGLAFLETLPGVGRKVSASTLNASTLAMPVLIVDTHVLRVLHRLGAIGAQADYRAASEMVTAAMPAWTGADFLNFHVEVKRLGQTLCRAVDPACHRCPLANDCPTAAEAMLRPQSRHSAAGK
jgi:endonuclease-3